MRDIYYGVWIAVGVGIAFVLGLSIPILISIAQMIVE